jgi:hypothetical protein
VILLFVGGVVPTLILNWLEPGATARVERLQRVLTPAQAK